MHKRKFPYNDSYLKLSNELDTLEYKDWVVFILTINELRETKNRDEIKKIIINSIKPTWDDKFIVKYKKLIKDWFRVNREINAESAN